MGDDCIRWYELEVIDSLPPEHPRRAHAETCPRCRALLLNFRAFRNPAPLPDAADRDGALARLDAFIDAEIGEAGNQEKAALSEPPRFWRRLRAALSSPALHPAYAVAAVGLLLLLFVSGPMRTERRGGDIVLRDGAPAPADTLGATVSRRGDGLLRLEWEARPEAEAYAIVIYGPDLAELLRLQISDSLGFDLRAGAHPELAGEGPYLWRVLALRKSGEIARSDLLPLYVAE